VGTNRQDSNGEGTKGRVEETVGALRAAGHQLQTKDAAPLRSIHHSSRVDDGNVTHHELPGVNEGKAPKGHSLGLFRAEHRQQPATVRGQVTQALSHSPNPSHQAKHPLTQHG
jgi:hypothetical protein